MCDMTHSYVWHDSATLPCDCTNISTSSPPLCVPWLIHMCDMTHLYVWHDSFICVTWLSNIALRLHQHFYVFSTPVCAMTHSFICVPWLILKTRSMTNSHCCTSISASSSRLCAKWLIPMCGISMPYVRHVFVWVGHAAYQWAMSLRMSHVTHMNESCHTHEWVMSHTWMSHVRYTNESYHTYEWVM